MNMENNKKMGIATIVNTAGAVLAYLIGAGFASGQEVMQFFSNWGSVGGLLEIGIIFVVFLTLTYIGVGYIGRTRNAANVNTLYEIIGGKIIGKVLSFFVWAYNLGCYFFMISGFGNVLNQQFGLSVPIGSAIAVVLSVGTALLGLRKMVDIIGKIGPVVVGFSLILGIVSAFWTFPHISEGAELVQSGAVHVNRAGHSVFLSALSYTGTCILLPMAYVAHLGHDLRGYRYKDTKAVMLSSSFSYSACCVILGLNYLGQYCRMLCGSDSEPYPCQPHYWRCRDRFLYYYHPCNLFYYVPHSLDLCVRALGRRKVAPVQIVYHCLRRDRLFRRTVHPI